MSPSRPKATILLINAVMLRLSSLEIYSFVSEDCLMFETISETEIFFLISCYSMEFISGILGNIFPNNLLIKPEVNP